MTTQINALTDEPITINVDDVPQTQCDNIAAAVLDGVAAFFSSTANRAKYNEWLAKRNQREALSDAGQCE